VVLTVKCKPSGVEVQGVTTRSSYTFTPLDHRVCRGDVAYCEKHGKNTTVHSLAAGLIYLSCGCFINPKEGT
jgi:hypothetical protein